VPQPPRPAVQARRGSLLCREAVCYTV
jgi:hypothetical protein